MDAQVKEMVSKYMKTVEMIVKSQGKKGNETAMIKLPYALQILDIPYSRIINYINVIIKVKRAIKSFRIKEGS